MTFNKISEICRSAEFQRMYRYVHNKRDIPLDVRLQSPDIPLDVSLQSPDIPLDVSLQSPDIFPVTVDCNIWIATSFGGQSSEMSFIFLSSDL
jgi:hypothetical protein